MKHREIRFATLGVLVFATMLLAQRAVAAPAVDEAETAKKTFATLKEKLPKVMEEWSKEHKTKTSDTCEVKSIRQIGATEAKATIVLSTDDPSGKPRVTQVVVIFLQYYDQRWTTTRFEHSEKRRTVQAGGFGAEGGAVQVPNDLPLRLLMLAIDECTEK